MPRLDEGAAVIAIEVVTGLIGEVEIQVARALGARDLVIGVGDRSTIRTGCNTGIMMKIFMSRTSENWVGAGTNTIGWRGRLGIFSTG